MATLCAVALTGIGASPIFAASANSTGRPPPPSPVPTLTKPAPDRPTAQEFQQALGVPLEDAGGGAAFALEQDAQKAATALRAAGYTVNQTKLDENGESAEIFVAGPAPSLADQAYARSQAGSASITFVAGSRTIVQAEALQARIDADRPALAQQGIRISTTGIIEDGSTILVRLIDGTSADTDYLLKTYGPDRLRIDTAPGPQPEEAAATRTTDYAPWFGGDKIYIPAYT